MTRMHCVLLAAAALLSPVSPALAEGGPAGGEVTGVSVLASPGKAEVVINVHGAVQVRDFMLHAPDRLVVDVVGATLSTRGALYDGVKRGGVVNLRYSQFRPDVVRIVLDLDGAKEYKLARANDEVRVSFGSDKVFAAWSSASVTPLAEAAGDAVVTPRAREPEVRLAQMK